MNQELAERWTTRLLAGLILANGLVALFRPLAERIPEHFESVVLLANYETLTRSLDIVLGTTLIYLSYQLLRRRLLAWWLSLAASVGLILLHLGASRWFIAAALPILTTVLLIASKRYFKAKSEPRDIRQGVLALAVSLVIALAYGTIGFWYMHERDFGINFSLVQSASLTLRAYLLLGNPNLIPHSRHARWFLDSLGVVGGVTLAFGLYSFFRPLEYILLTAPRLRARAEELLVKYSHSSEDFFKLWPHDKSYFFSSDQQAFLAYGVHSGIALVVEDPVGQDQSLKQVVTEFNQYCIINGWTPAYIYVTSRHIDLLKSADMNILKIGEDAVVDINKFVSVTSKNKHFRNIANRFAKAGFSAAFYDPPHSHQLMDEVAAVSAAWLSQPDRKEWRFLAGNFNDRYMQMCRLFVLRDSHNQVLAFVNLIPTYTNVATIDLMRYRPDAPPNIMDFLFLKLLPELTDYRFFNLGLAPFSGLALTKGKPEERLLNLLYRSNQRFISFQGLRRFKAKFEPDWEPKYVAYRGTVARAARIAYALSRLMS